MWLRRKAGKPNSPSATLGTPERAVGGLKQARLPVDLLQQGMRVVKLDRPWTDVPVLYQGFRLSTDAQLQTLRQYCDWVLVESEVSIILAAEEALKQRQQLTLQPLPETAPLEQALPQARQAYDDTQTFINRLLDSLTQNTPLNLADAKPLIRSCVRSINTNANALFWLARIKDQDAYTAEHCLRVAIFAIAFAKFMGLPEDDLEVVGLCGLLHDIGKLKVPDAILNKPGPLTPEEMADMQRHTQLGHQLLAADSNLDSIVADVSLQHHERMDGKGYPNQLASHQISRFARLITIVDVYDAVTSDRCYRTGRSPADAMGIIYKGRGEQFDADMVEAFIRMIGIYPPGSLVELSNGEVGLVVGSHPQRKLKPRLELLLDRDKQPQPARLIDLGEAPTDGHGQAYSILKPLSDGAYGLSLHERIRELTSKNPSGTPLPTG
ncbi:MAG: HD-GYP domain-containing protein [Marinobacter sp.]|nr:HD-GYP domain-containing protein [Marinobacter sp.]